MVVPATGGPEAFYRPTKADWSIKKLLGIDLLWPQRDRQQTRGNLSK
jgi:hypothetical protein